MFRSLMFFFILSVSLFASNVVGKFTQVNGNVKVQHENKLVVATNNMAIYKSDKIYTYNNSMAKILLLDDTQITLQENTFFQVSKYIYDPQNKDNNQVQLNFFKGQFETITGKIGKLNPSKFKLKTKNASIGIRGTVIEGSVGETTDIIACTFGLISVTSNGITQMVQQGQMTKVDRALAPTKPEAYDKQILKKNVSKEINISMTKEATPKAETADTQEEVVNEPTPEATTQPEQEVPTETTTPTDVELEEVTVTTTEPTQEEVPEVQEEVSVPQTTGIPEDVELPETASEETLNTGVPAFVDLPGQANVSNDQDLNTPPELVEDEVQNSAVGDTVLKGFAVSMDENSVSKTLDQNDLVVTFNNTDSQVKADINTTLNDFNSEFTDTNNVNDTYDFSINKNDGYVDTLGQYDYTAWGEWKGTNPEFNNTTGHWIAGEQTMNDDLPDSGTIDYDGIVLGTVYNGTDYESLNGTSSIRANFDNDEVTGTLSIKYADSGNTFSNAQLEDVTIQDAQNFFSGDLKDGNDTGSIEGVFFGPQAAEVGGQWELDKDGNSATGIFTGQQ